MLKRKNVSDDSGQAKRPRLDAEQTDGLAQIRTSRPSPAPKVTSEPESPKAPGEGKRKKKGKKQETTATGITATQTRSATVRTMCNLSGRRETIHKLAPPRPFPTVPSSVSASGPKSAHKEGKNFICITRHTSLAAYLSRCKKILVDDGYRTLHLHAMGAAIPHLLTLSVSLPPILPFSRKEIKVEVRTGTVEVMDEIIPEDEDEDMSVRARGKGVASVLIQIQDGKECASTGVAQSSKQTGRAEGKGNRPRVLIVQEQEQEDEMDEDDDEVEE